MSKNNEFIHTYDILGTDLKYVEIIDMCDTGEKRWFVKNLFDNTTPLFDNLHDFIKINDNSCMFLGRYNGNTKLFVTNGSNNNNFYDEIELDGNPNELIDYDSKYAIVKSISGIYFFDKENLKRSSDIFDSITTKVVDGKSIFVFEKEVKDNTLNISKKIVGIVSKDGKIGNFLYDESINGLRSTPKIDVSDSYDLLDSNVLYKELEELYYKKKDEKKEYIKKLLKINR